MKRVTECLGGCGMMIRLYGNYQVSAEVLVENTKTGKVSMQVVEGRICKGCAEKAGYVIDRKKNKRVESRQSKTKRKVSKA